MQATIRRGRPPAKTQNAGNEEIAASDIAIFASPTYKASDTGMLKAFLDRYGSNGLAGVVAARS
jgi:FMN reductase